MKKRLVAFFAAAILTLQAVPSYATGQYYEQKTFPKITADELVYKKVDVSVLEKKLETIKKLVLKLGNGTAVVSATDECFEFYREARNSYVLATLAYDRDCSTENEANLAEASEINISVAELLSELVYCLYDSDYQYILAEIFGEAEAALAFALPADDELADLLGKEQELQNTYSRISDDTQASAELFCELVMVRNKLAGKFGYYNYADYADDAVYGREYTDEELAEFNDAVLENFVPMYENSMSALWLLNSDEIPMSEDDVLLNTRAIVKRINPELGSSFDYLIANNIYDIKNSDKKNPISGAYTVLMPKSEVPYIFLNPIDDYEENGVYTVSTLLHEFGHFSAMLNEADAGMRYGSLLLSTCVDTAEIHSQGLEVLSEHYYGKAFGATAPLMRYYLLASISGTVIDGCLMNEWQREVYEADDITLDDMNALCARLAEKYYGIECTNDEAMEIWTSVPHNFIMPMYYASYALSGAAALGIYADATMDYDSAVDTYMKVSAEGIYRSFGDVSRNCGLVDIFDGENIYDIARKLNKVYAFDYSDITGEEWYMPYLYTVSNIIPHRTENMYMPETPVTRAEFIGTLGRMYDYYEGIDEEYTVEFSDISDDENTRYIAWGAANGIMQGYDDTTFGTNDVLTREQAATVLFRLAGNEKLANELYIFTDFGDISDWAKSAVLWAAECGIIDGYENGEFMPQKCITRAETAKITAEYLTEEYKK